MPLGWHISVYRQQNDGSAPASFTSAEGTRLAVWQAGLYGLEWIDELVKQQEAISLGGDGYPVRFTAMAKHIIPRLRGEPPQARDSWAVDPGDVILPGWLGKTTKDSEAMGACRLDEWLLLEAWDES